MGSGIDEGRLFAKKKTTTRSQGEDHGNGSRRHGTTKSPSLLEHFIKGSREEVLSDASRTNAVGLATRQGKRVPDLTRHNAHSPLAHLFQD